MKIIFAILVTLLAFTSCGSQIRVVQLETGKIETVDFQNYAELFSVGDTVVVMKIRSYSTIKLYGKYHGYIPNTYSNTYFSKTDNDSITYTITYAGGIIIK